MKRVLVVDDEKNMRVVLKMLLEGEGYIVAIASDGQEAIDSIERGEVFDLVITDLKMPNADGLVLLEYLTGTRRNIPVVLITAYGTIPDAVNAMRNGAVDFITKPFNAELILHQVERILQLKSLEEKNELLSVAAEDDGIVYKSELMHQVMTMVEKVAEVSTPVLITGESGTGKELVARALHDRHRQTDCRPETEPFARINCAAIPEHLFESELFGYRRGAFTGATGDYKGKLRVAEEGTFFLDEIGELPIMTQPKLLHVLEQHTFEPLGSTTTIRTDCRFVCATNQDLKERTENGLFRKDLYYRINAIQIKLPPLRNRRDDIPVLFDHFLARYSRELRKIVRVDPATSKAINAYDWPGNVRELKNAVERLVVLAGENQTITPDDLPLEIADVGMSDQQSSPNRLEESEMALIRETLEATEWNVSKAAVLLGVPRGNLRYRIVKYRLGVGK